jgi:hypothetical protein
MLTSRSVPQSTAQIFSPLAGQYLSPRRFSHIEQIVFFGILSRPDYYAAPDK